MALTKYDIIKGPIISDKAYKLNKKLKQLMLEVHLDATKSEIKKALEQLFNVKVQKVRTQIRKYTRKGLSRGRPLVQPKQKQDKYAFITLAPGYSLDLFESVAPTESEKQSTQE